MSLLSRGVGKFNEMWRVTLHRGQDKSLTTAQYSASRTIFTHNIERSWLRHCATGRKVEGSIPDGVIGIFHLHNPSGRTMALGLTQPLTEMSTRNISWGLKAADA